jgi:predicted lipoprotein with Yx(FWY)xxD motif
MRRRGSRLGSIVVAAVMLAVAAVALAATATKVTTHQTKRGKVLAAGANGHTLYLFTHDQGKASRCNGGCAAGWPPLLTKGRAAAVTGSGVNAKLLGTTLRANGRIQVTYAGHPVYEYTGDTKAGQTSGEGANVFGGHWYMLSTSGKALKPKSGGACNPLCPGY